MANAHSDSATGNAASIAEAQLANVPDMAQCHIMAFPRRFMTEMGLRWLCALYRFFIKHRGGICYVAVDAVGNVLGFAVGGEPDIRDQFLRAAMLRYPHLIFCKFITIPLVRRILLEELGKKLRLKRPAPPSEDVKTQGTAAYCGNLLSICVLPECKGTGIANKLIESFQLACATKGYKRLTLSVVTENARAIAFYRKHDWHETGKSGENTKFALDL